MNSKYQFIYKKSKMFYLFFFIIFIFQIFCYNRNLQTTGSELSIKINGIGIQSVISKDFNGGFPNKILCNDLEAETNDGYQINIQTNLSTIKLVWNSK